MPLSTHTIVTAPVRLSATNDFRVRAITFPDLTILVRDRMEALVAIVAKFQEARPNPGAMPNAKSVGEIALMAARDFPSLAVEIISSCVYGEEVTPEMRLMIGALPMPTQLHALTEIGRLTMEEAGGLGNLLADFRLRLAEAGAGEGSPQTTTQTPSV